MAATLISVSGHAQTGIAFNKTAKVYFLSDIKTPNRQALHPGVNTAQTSFIRPTVAFGWTDKKNKTHELELAELLVGKDHEENNSVGSTPYYAYNIYRIRIAVRYEYRIDLVKHKEHKLRPSIGIGAMVYNHRDSYKPQVSNIYPYRNHSTGIMLQLIPRLQYKISSRLYADLNVPVGMADVVFTGNRIANPSLKAKEQTFSTFSFTTLPEYFCVRLGAGILL